MRYYFEYYFKKFWILIVLLILSLFVAFIVSSNDTDLISFFEKYENKISFTPDHYKEESIDSDLYLSDLNVSGIPYIGTSLRPYVPTAIKEELAKKSFEREFIKDPDIVYKKNISWASGSLTYDNLEELIELIGFHLNKNSNNKTIIVRLPSQEELMEFGEEVVYYTNKSGVLHLNVFVDEIDSTTDIKKSYCYTFRLKYDMAGKVTIK